ADLTKYLPLGFGNIGIAETNDFVDWWNGFGAIGQSRHRLRSADFIYFLNTRYMCRCQQCRIKFPIRCRNDHSKARYACYCGWHGIHQYRTRISRQPAGNVEPNRSNSRPPMAEAHALLIVIIEI